MTARRRGRRRRPSRFEDSKDADAASTCFHLDSVCSRQDGWFYIPQPAGGQQPTIRLLVDPWDVTDTHGYQTQVEERLRFNVSATIRRPGRAGYSSTTFLKELQCRLDPAPVHLVA